jgi:hypothetical protein
MLKYFLFCHTYMISKASYLLFIDYFTPRLVHGSSFYPIAEFGLFKNKIKNGAASAQHFARQLPEAGRLAGGA